MSKENKIILYQDDNEITRVSVRFADEDLWLTQNQLAEIYCTTQQNISQHVDNIYKDGELAIEATNKKFLLVRQEGNRQVKRNIDHYNLDMIIALGYRVQSQVDTPLLWKLKRNISNLIEPVLLTEDTNNPLYADILKTGILI